MTATSDAPASASASRATYRNLFAQREFSALFSAHVVSMLGTIVADLALTLLIYARTGSTFLAALTFTIGFLPFLIGGTLLSGVVDRMPARRVMVICNLCSAAVFAVMTLPGLPIFALLALIFAGGLIAPIFGGTRSAIMPDVLGHGQRYVLGQATMRMVAQGAQVIGFGVGGLLVAALGARFALAIDAASFATSALVVRFGIKPRPPATPAGGSLLRDSLHGVRAVLTHSSTRRVLLFRWLMPTCALAPEALAAAYIHAIDESASALGVFLCAVPAAMVLADLIGGRFLSGTAQRRLIVPGGLLNQLPLLGFIVMPRLPVAVALLVLVGFGYCHALGLDKVLLETVPETLRARGLAVDQAGLMVLQGVGFAVWGGLAELLPLRITIVVAGLCGIVAVCLLARAADRLPSCPS